MTVSEIRKKYLDFFRARGHVVVPSAKLVPENDPTTLFTGSGMQPMLPYFLGEPHPQGKRVADSQKSFRAQDIEEVGDNRHTTFFEMLGNWSFGDYFKDEQIPWMFQFLTDELNLDISRLYFTCYKGNDALGIPRDEYSAKLWQSLYAEKGIEAGIGENPEEDGMVPGARIFYYGDSKNWWSRVGEPQNMPTGEPGGPDTEMFFDFGDSGQHAASEFKDHPCHVNCDCGRFVEIGNNVFMEYVKTEDGFTKLPKPNVDFGAGLERMAMAVKGVDDIFLIDTMQTVIAEIAAASGKEYKGENKTSFRIIADHIRGSTFMLGDGVRPGNTDQGYVLRRLIRRAIRHLDRLGVDNEGTLVTLSERVIGAYRDQYSELDANRLAIHGAIREEEQKFRKTLASGMKEFEKGQWVGVADEVPPSRGTFAGHAEKILPGEIAFKLFSTFGFPIELTVELAKERGMEVDMKGFEEEMKKHQTTSRAGAEQKFKGGLADAGEQTTKLHTATHLMLAGLRKYLGNHVHQAGSNITAERTRFDFTYGEKVPRDILDKVEAYVNEAIEKKCSVVMVQMPKEQAQAEGVEGSFWEKYPDIVNVYMVKCDDGMVYSRELCGGPHVQNTKTMGTFSIVKEEASSAGVRRVKATLS